jgi:hypothetical protein
MFDLCPFSQKHNQNINQGPAQACSQGAAYPHTNLVAPTKNLQNIKEKQADQPTKKPATSYHIHVLPLLNCHG